MTVPSRRRPPLPEPQAAPTLAAFLAARRSALGAIAVVAAAAVGGGLLWSRYADDVRAHPDAVLFPEQVELRGLATWVRGDLRTEALESASLDGGLPIDDPELPARLGRAFARHPWVREVVRVDVRQPAAAIVEVRCREPVAMVRVHGGLYAVDAEGVVLPSEDFTPESAAVYPTIADVRTTPVSAAGTPWGDPLVVEGAAVAAAIGPEWPALGLHELRPVAASGGGVIWELSGDGRMIRFGAAPGRERPGEPTAAAKLARLRDLASGAGGAGAAAAALVDLTIAAPEAPGPIGTGEQDPARP